jgi:hypothetical protein
MPLLYTKSQPEPMKNNSGPAKKLGIALFVLLLAVGAFFTVREVQNQQELRGKASTGISPTPVNACADIATQSTCTWDPLPSAVTYDVTVINTVSKEVVKSGTVQAPVAKFEFPYKPGETYECSVNAANACGAGATDKSQPTTCSLSPTPTPTAPVCKEDESKCTWDSLPDASEYIVKIIDTNTGETIKSGSVSASINEFTFASLTDVSYKCEVTPVNQCGEGTSESSPPLVCTAPTPTPTLPELTPSPSTPITSVEPTPTPTVPELTPTNTPIPTSTPLPTPTNTPVPTNTPAPTQTPYPTNTPIPTQPPVVIVRNNPNPPVNQTTQVTVVTQNPVYTTPPPQKIYPTLAPTGIVENSIIIAGISMILIAIGGAIFFLL